MQSFLTIEINPLNSINLWKLFKKFLIGRSPDEYVVKAMQHYLHWSKASSRQVARWMAGWWSTWRWS